MQEPALSTDSGAPLVNIQGSHGSFIISLDPGAEFESLRSELRRMLQSAPEQYKGASARLDIGKRRITLFDIRRFMSLLKEEFQVQTTALYCTQKAVLQYAEHELKLRVIPKDAHERAADTEELIETKDPEDTNVVEAQVEEMDSDSEAATMMADAIGDLSDADLEEDEEAAGGQRVLTVDRTLRSGAIIRFPGDVVVFGDVNAGAQIEAAGNILVLGALRGLAHAGASGDERCVIISFDLRPTQIRIGNKIAMAPDDRPERPKHATPEIAWVDEEAVVIEDYAGKLPF